MSKQPGLYARKLKVNCMKFTSSRDAEQKSFGKFFTFSVDFDEVIIEESISEGERPTEFWGNSELEFEKGATISAKKIWGCCDKRPGRIKKGQSDERSGRHSRQTVEIKGNICYAVIITNWNDENIILHPLDYEKNVDTKKLQ